MLRLTKLFSFLNLNYILKSEYGNEIYNFFKKNSGYGEILKNMIYILVCSHMYTITLYSVRYFINNNSNEWLDHHYDERVKNLPSINLYLFLLCESIKTSLGLSVRTNYASYEIVMEITWMFVGLSLFGYGIGNISSFLNYANQQDIEHTNALNYFNDLITLYGIDPKLQTHIIRDVGIYFEKYSDRQFLNYGKMLMNNTFYSLETSIYSDYINNFKLLEKFATKTVRKFKNKCTISNYKYVLRQYTTITEVLFVISGTIYVYDHIMRIKNKYEQGDIMGLRYFYEYCKNKYNIDFENIFSSSIDNTKQQQQNLSKSIYVMLGEINKHKIRRSDSTIVNIEINNKLLYNFKAIGCDDVKYIIVPFEMIEDMLFDDMEGFKHLYDYHQLQIITISEQYFNVLKDEWNVINNSEDLILICHPDGKVYGTNTKLKNWMDEREVHETISDLNIFDILNSDSSWFYGNIIQEKNMDLIINKEYNVKLFGYSLNLGIFKVENKKLLTFEDLRNRIIDSDFQIYDKNLVNCYIVNITIKNR